MPLSRAPGRYPMTFGSRGVSATRNEAVCPIMMTVAARLRAPGQGQLEIEAIRPDQASDSGAADNSIAGGRGTQGQLDVRACLRRLTSVRPPTFVRAEATDIRACVRARGGQRACVCVRWPACVRAYGDRQACMRALYWCPCVREACPFARPGRTGPVIAGRGGGGGGGKATRAAATGGEILCECRNPSTFPPFRRPVRPEATLVISVSAHRSDRARAPTISVDRDSAALSCQVHPSRRSPCPLLPRQLTTLPPDKRLALLDRAAQIRTSAIAPPHRPGASLPQKEPEQYAGSEFC